MEKRDVQRGSPRPSKPLIPTWLITFVVVFVMLIWGGNLVYAMNNPKYSVPAAVHGIATGVVTGLMGYLAVRGGRRNGD